MKIKKSLITLFNILFIVTFLYILKISIFNTGLFLELNPFIVVACTFALLSVYMIFRAIINKNSTRTLVILNCGILLMLIVIQLIVIKKLVVNPSWDFGAISTAANKMAVSGEVGNVKYFNQYPGNLGVSVLLSFVYKFAYFLGFSPESYVKLGMLFNIFMIDLALILGFVLVRLEKGNKCATLYSFTALFITPLYMYSPIFYTDTLTLIYPVIVFLFYLLYRKYDKTIWLVLLGILGGIGIFIKANVAIALIALMIFVIFVENIKGILKTGSIVITSILIVSLSFNYYLKSTYNLNIKEIGFPATHWVMMGLKDDGGYDYDDVVFTLDTSPEKRKEENIRVIKERIKEYGPVGLIKHLDKKLKVTWGDGSLYAPSKLKRKPVYEGNKLGQYVYGDKNQIYLYISQASFVIIILGILISAFEALRKKDIKLMQNVFNISIFGVLLFLLIWETRSRYLVCFLIVMMMSSIYGLEYLYNNLNKFLFKGKCREK